MMRSKKKKPTAEDRASMAKEYLAGAEKRGELDPKHSQEFDGLFDAVAPKVPAKKK